MENSQMDTQEARMNLKHKKYEMVIKKTKSCFEDYCEVMRGWLGLTFCAKDEPKSGRVRWEDSAHR